MIESVIVWSILKPHRLIRCIRDACRVRRLVGIRRLCFVLWLLKLLVSRGFHRHIRAMIETAQGKCPDPRLGGWIDFPSGVLIYILVRHARPEVVVETGVGPGGTTAFILLALHHNHCGRLHSIDLPGNDTVVYPALGKDFNVHVPEGLKPGWLVPSWLADRWELTLGDSREQLPSVLRTVGRVDVFLHDSLHTDEHIMMEFGTVLAQMKAGGILLCDDVNELWSLAFLTFCGQHGIPHVCFKDRIGVGVVSRVDGASL